MLHVVGERSAGGRQRTEPICDREDAFGIEMGESDALELYDMALDRAARLIMEIRKWRVDRGNFTPSPSQNRT